MKRTVLIFVSLVGIAVLAVPIRSLLGTKGSEYAESIEPPESAIVEYLESSFEWQTTGPYILSKYSIEADNRFVIEMEYLGTYSGTILGRNAGSYECFVNGNGTGYFGGGSFNASMSFVRTGQHIIDFDLTTGNMKLTIDGRDIKTSNRTQPNRGAFPLFICTANANNTLNRTVHCRVYGLAVYRFGELVEELVPIRFLNEMGEQEGAMYNKVDGTIYRNVGTDKFLFGKDVGPIN